MSTKRKLTSSQSVIQVIQKQCQAKCQQQAQAFKKQIAALELKNKQLEKTYYNKGFQSACKAFKQLENAWEKSCNQANAKFESNCQKLFALGGTAIASKTKKTMPRKNQNPMGATVPAARSLKKIGARHNGNAGKRVKALASYRVGSTRRNHVGNYHA